MNNSHNINNRSNNNDNDDDFDMKYNDNNQTALNLPNLAYDTSSSTHSSSLSVPSPSFHFLRRPGNTFKKSQYNETR